MKNLFTFFAIFFAGLLSTFASQIKFSAKLESGENQFPQNILINYSIPQGWHIYGNESKIGMPTKIEISLPNGIVLDSIEWQKEKKLKQGNFEYYGYDSDVKVIAKISKQQSYKNIATEKDSKIMIKSQWLACSDDTCIPEDATIEIPLPPHDSISKGNEDSKGLFAVLFAAFLGGIILNLMPCVFPVIGIKIMSFAKSTTSSRSSILINALFYTLGIVLSFVVLASILLALRAAGESLGWGFQLQNPIFSALMSLLFFAMALSFAGLFEIGTSFTNLRLENSNSDKNKYIESFLSGILAVLVASPCTAPFMGSAVGVALSTNISTELSISVFIVLGLGMSSPYILLSIIPNLSKFLPKSGAWLEVLKKIFSIPLFLTALWLAWLYSKQTGDILRITIASSALFIGLFVYGKFALPHRSKIARLSAVISLIILSVISVFSIITPFSQTQDETTIDTEIWSTENVEKLKKSGVSVYVDFTASWCLTCQYNKLILHSRKISELFRENNIKILVGDWTNRDSKIADELKKFGRAGVPLNILYPPQGDPIVLPAILTESAIIEAVDKIK